MKKSLFHDFEDFGGFFPRPNFQIKIKNRKPFITSEFDFRHLYNEFRCVLSLQEDRSHHLKDSGQYGNFEKKTTEILKNHKK